MSAWETLSAIDCSAKVEKKGNLSYLSWAWAWAEVMGHYPTATYEFQPPVFFNDGSCEVWVAVTIEEISHSMWLPVMDNRNNAVMNPDSRKISDARMRCLTKCLAMFGLGHYIYAGEDIPQVSTDGNQASRPAARQSTANQSSGVTLSFADKQWIEAINCGGSALEDINDPEHRAFIKSQLGSQQ
jgi:hypothetical protein